MAIAYLPHVMIYLKLLLTALLWGGTFIAGRVVMQSMGVFSAAFCRFAIATVVLLGITRWTLGKLPRLNRHQALLIGLSGLIGVFAYNTFFLLGLKLLPASRAALIVALNPIAVTLCSAWLYRERLSALRLGGVGISLLGAAIVIAQGNPLHLLQGGWQPGDGLLLGCVGSWVVYTLIGQRVLQTVSPLVATTYACGVGALALLPLALNEGLLGQLGALPLAAGLSVTYMGLGGTVVAFLWYFEGVRVLGAARTSVFTNFVPAAAVLLSVLLLHETIHPSLIGGGLLISLGVFLTSRQQASKPS
jgi:drug/metabolite transporter (DMT)-like permease